MSSTNTTHESHARSMSQRPLAVVTGASSGIGYELAICCARDGFDLVVAADKPEIHDAANTFRGFNVDVEAVQVDLATRDGVDRVCAATRSRPVDALLANAGHGLGNSFLDQNFDDAQHVIDTNITGTIYLIQKIGREMRNRGSGQILITGSIAGFTPGTYSAVYNASKAFIDSFSHALRAELKDSGISVTCLMPGATETEFFERAGMMDTQLGQSEKDHPADVAKAGFEAMKRGDADVVSGWKNKVIATVATVAPAGFLAEQHRKRAEPGSGNNKTALSDEQPSHSDNPSPSKGIAKAAVVAGAVIGGAGLIYAVRTFRKDGHYGNGVARDVHIETSIAINKEPAELFKFWRKLENLPNFMHNLLSVTELDEKRSHWVARGLRGPVEWDAEIYNEKENELIAWRSVGESDVVNAGSVRFQPGPEEHGTYVRITLNYNPPAGTAGQTIARLFGANAEQLINDDLKRLKQLLETGEIATIAGQTSARAENAQAVA
jgi:short-subunit dehydrogenase/uncharacterized membrane protein